MRLRLARLLDSVDTYTYNFDPYVPRSSRPALRRPDQHRHRPRQRAAPLPRRQRRGGAVVVAVLLRRHLGQQRRAPRCGRCSPWSPTTGSTPTSRARATRSRRPRLCWTAAGRGLEPPVESSAADAPARRPGRRSEHTSEEQQPWALSCRSTAAPPSPTPRHQARRPPDRRGQEGRPRRRRRRLRHGRHHRRAARPRRAGQPAAAGPRARHAAHRRRADLDGAGGDGDLRPRLHRPLVHRLAGRRDHRLGARQGQDHRRHPGPDLAGARRRPRSSIVAGFQGVSQDTKEITTLGRGGTDTTAVALAAALDADVCEIYTDVDGVFTADPRIVPTARKLDRVTYEEMLELAACGAKILHLRCVEYARRYDIPIHVRSSFSQLGGHLVVNGQHQRRGPAGATMEAGDHRRRRPRPQRGQDHRRRRARQGRRGRTHLRGARRAPRSTST